MRHIFLPHAHAFDSSVLTFSPKFWLFIVITGIGAGLGADGLMALLTTVQHVSYNYEQGYFQTAVAQVSADLEMPVTAIRSDQSRKEVLNLLQQTFFSQLPVVDGITMQYMGIIKQNCDCSA